jgi:hypothetical protein
MQAMAGMVDNLKQAIDNTTAQKANLDPKIYTAMLANYNSAIDCVKRVMLPL